MSISQSPIHTPLIAGLLGDANHKVLDFLDNETARVLPLVNTTWRSDPDVQERVEQATRGVLFERRIPIPYAILLRSTGTPIHRLPSCDLSHQPSFSPRLETPHPIIRGIFQGDVPFIQIRVKGRPTSNASYQSRPNVPHEDARNVDGYILIYQRYIGTNTYYCIGDPTLENFIRGRHNQEEDHEFFIGCDNCPIQSGMIKETVLAKILWNLDPDLRVI